MLRQALRELKVSAKYIDESEFLESKSNLVLSAEQMSNEQLVFRDMVWRRLTLCFCRISLYLSVTILAAQPLAWPPSSIGNNSATINLTTTFHRDPAMVPPEFCFTWAATQPARTFISRRRSTS